MIVIPDTEVRLLSSVPLTNTYEHQLTFGSAIEQSTFFQGKTSHTFLEFTYVREDSTIKVNKARDQLYACNYVMFKNKDFSNKWFYGFVTKIEYVNPNVSKVHFELDVFQTWQFDFTFRPSFIEREHQKRWNLDGSPVINTIDEGLNYGTDYETVSVTQFVPHNDVFFLVIVCQQRMDTNGSDIDPVVNGSIQPLTYYVHPFKMDGSVPAITVDGLSQTLDPVKDVLKALYKSEVAVNNIASLYITEYIGHPSLAYDMQVFEPVNIQDGATNFVTLRVKNVQSYQQLVNNFGDKYSGFSEVSESKLLMHPYTVTILSDMKGNLQELKNEYIQSNNLEIAVKGSIGVSNKVSYHVRNYLLNEGMANGSEVALERGIINNSPNDVPIITELLSAYLQGNRNSLANQTDSILFNQMTGLAGNVMTANLTGGISDLGNSYLQMKGIVAKQKDISNQPPQLSRLGGNTAFDYGNDLKGLYIIKRQITPEYQKKLSDFFKMYGYKLNEVKVPNLSSRQHFNFIKTVGANVTGNVPADDLVVIKKMFDNGVTLWHGDYVGDYTLSNNEV